MPRFPFSTLNVSSRSVKRISPKVDIFRGLAVIPAFPWLPQTVEGDTVLPQVQEQAPVDGREIVGWMQEAAAFNAALEGMCEDYTRAGSMLVSRVGDGFIPSVGVGSGTKSAKFTSVRAETVARDRGAYFTAGGTRFFCPEYGKATAITKDFLAWAAVPSIYAIQWIAALLAWLDLAKSPITDRIRFAGCRGLTAPNFVTVSPRLPAPVVTMRLGMTSDKPQTVAVNGRSLTDYTGVLFSDEFAVDEGESETIYTLMGFPFVGDFLLEMQPENGTQTVLDYIETMP